GRTARADADGKAVTFVSERDRRRFAQIESFLDIKVRRDDVPGELGGNDTAPARNDGKGRGRNDGKNRRRDNKRPDGKRSEGKNRSKGNKPENATTPADTNTAAAPAENVAAEGAKTAKKRRRWYPRKKKEQQ
ncbi:MAG: hypothetical protein K2L28_05255, partial [Muribaculaceae bacterium]|nr:hypothetical protein [Muribaculaceae bacterium]